VENSRARVDARNTGILIVGAGAVGLTLALGLTRQGARYRIVDRDARPSRTSSPS
jgi:2-polyprenyl-6-methoxyphenol hydroxylase-like FAD-dependent oxidoreductase